MTNTKAELAAAIADGAEQRLSKARDGYVLRTESEETVRVLLGMHEADLPRLIEEFLDKVTSPDSGVAYELGRYAVNRHFGRIDDAFRTEAGLPLASRDPKTGKWHRNPSTGEWIYPDENPVPPVKPRRARARK